MYKRQAVDEADDFLLSLGIDIGAIVAEASTLDRLDLLREAYNTIISNDENKDKFKVDVYKRQQQNCTKVFARGGIADKS